jgi:HK97 family phage portal protein
MIGTSSNHLAKRIKGQLRHATRSGLTRRDVSDEQNAQQDYADFEVQRDFMTSAYQTNEWIRAIVDLTSERASQVEIFPRPITAKTGDGNISDATKKNMEILTKILIQPNSDLESMHSLQKRAFKDVLVYDEAGIQISKSADHDASGTGYSLHANVSGEEVYVNPNRDGTLPLNRAYAQIRNGEIVATWGKYEWMNFIKNRRAGYANGFSPISTIVMSIMGDLEMMNYNYKFFKNNAKPNIAFVFDNLGFGKGRGALERAKAWYKKEHQGKPHLPLFMGAEKGNVKIQQMQATHKDMEFSDWSILLLSRIMSVYGMQPMVLGILTDTTGKLNSEVQTEQYKRNAIIPLVRTLTSNMNAALVWSNKNLGFNDLYLTSTDLDLDDEKKQAEINEVYLDRGVITINQVRNALQMPPVEWGDEPFVPLNYSPLSTLEALQNAKIDSLDIDQGSNTGKQIWARLKKEMKADLPTGLENVDKTVIEDVLKKLGAKYRKMHKTYIDVPWLPNGGLVSNIRKYDLTWK